MGDRWQPSAKSDVRVHSWRSGAGQSDADAYVAIALSPRMSPGDWVRAPAFHPAARPGRRCLHGEGGPAHEAVQRTHVVVGHLDRLVAVAR